MLKFKTNKLYYILKYNYLFRLLLFKIFLNQIKINNLKILGIINIIVYFFYLNNSLVNHPKKK